MICVQDLLVAGQIMPECDGFIRSDNLADVLLRV